jgi:hypothetical protein
MSVDARHRRVGSRLAEEATGRLAPRDGPRLTLSVPVDGFGDVARCVLGGAAGMVDLGFEAIDDVQLALELVLRSGVVLGDSATIAIAGDPTGLVVGVSEVDATVARRLLCAK